MTHTSEPRTPRLASRVSGHTLLIVAAVLTVFTTAGVLINDLVRVIYMYEGAYDLQVLLVSHEGLPASLDGDSALTTSFLSTVLISSHESLEAARLLQSLAIGLTTLTFLAAAVVILSFCRRLWSRRTFTASTAVAIFVLAGLTLLSAWLAPLLRHLADESALGQLGYDTSVGERWVELANSATDGSLLVLAAVLTLVGLIYLAARRLQQETDGLV